MQKFFNKSAAIKFGKLDFLVTGAQKSGTSALSKYLKEHPNTCMPVRKELHFFDNDKNFIKNKVDYKFYHKQFPGYEEGMRVGEATPIYMYWDQGFKRIWEYNLNIKIVVILRNPIDRAYSHWNMETVKGKEVRDFSTLIRDENEISKISLPDQNRIISYVDRGFYTSQLRRMWRFFNKAQTFVIKYDDFRSHPERVMSSLFQFLELEDIRNINFENVYSQNYSSEMTSEDREYLRDIFYYEIKSLEKMLDWDCTDWISS